MPKSIADVLIDSEEVDKADLRDYIGNRDCISVKDQGASGAGISDDTAAMEASNSPGRLVRIPAGEYLIDGPGDRGWVIHDPEMRVEGEGWAAELSNHTANKSIINVGDASKAERVSGNAVGFLTFKDQPKPAGTGSQNNEHPLHFLAADHPLAHFNRFINCGLGLRFGRVASAKGWSGGTPVGGDGTRFGLAIGTYFEDPRSMAHEIMDDGSYGNQIIGTRIANPDNSGNQESGATQSHSVRLNGRWNGIFGLTALDGMSTLASFQAGVGHALVAGIGTGQAQAIQVVNTEHTDGTPSAKYSLAVGLTLGNAEPSITTYGARISESTDFILGNAIIYNEEVPATSSAGVHLLRNSGSSVNNADPKYCVIGPVISSKTRGSAGFPHHFLQGHYHRIDVLAHDAEHGPTVFELDTESSECTLDVSVARAASNAPGEDVRIEGVGHMGRIRGERIIVSGSGHVLDIRQPENTSLAITVNASDCILRIWASGAVAVNGSRNDITLQSMPTTGTVLTLGGDNNTVRGIRRTGGNVSNPGAGNDVAGLRAV